MLVSYKYKNNWWTWMPSEELAEKMSTTGIEVEGVASAAAGLSKFVVGEVLSCEDAKTSCLSHRVKKKPVKSFVEHQMCRHHGGSSSSRIADNHKIKKGKIRGLEPFGWSVPLGKVVLLTPLVPKEFADGIQTCLKMWSQEKHFTWLGRWNIVNFPSPKPCRRSFLICVG